MGCVATRLAKPRHGSQACGTSPATLRWGACDTATSACDTAGGHGHARVRLGAPVRPWVCWLGQVAVHTVHLFSFWTQYCF